MTNNIMHSAGRISGGEIRNNIITSYRFESSGSDYPLRNVNSSTITQNVFLSDFYPHGGSDCTATDNMSKFDWGDRFKNKGSVSWTDIFADYNNGTISPASNFHFKGEYLQYEGEIGIYGGTEPFQDSALPPVPYIVSKVIPEQTDASGKLNIKIRVKAGE